MNDDCLFIGTFFGLLSLQFDDIFYDTFKLFSRSNRKREHWQNELHMQSDGSIGSESLTQRCNRINLSQLHPWKTVRKQVKFIYEWEVSFPKNGTVTRTWTIEHQCRTWMWKRYFSRNANGKGQMVMSEIRKARNKWSNYDWNCVLLLIRVRMGMREIGRGANGTQ